MTLKQATGVLVQGQSVVGLSREVSEILAITCGSLVMIPVGSKYEFPDDETHARPTIYAVHGNKMHVWPIPDRGYTVNIKWIGDGGLATEIASLNDALPPEFMRLYRDELRKAKGATS